MDYLKGIVQHFGKFAYCNNPYSHMHRYITSACCFESREAEMRAAR